MKRVGLLVFFLGMAVAASSFELEQPAYAQQGKATPGKARSGGVYRAPLLNNPPTLDPPYVKDMYGVTVIQQLFDGLIRYSPDLYAVPALAENWQVEDGGRSYRFVLRKDARFHNGKPVTSTDVVFSLSRLLKAQPSPTILPHMLKISGAEDYIEGKTEEVKGLQAVDVRTVRVRLDEPYVPFLTALGMYQAKILPKEEVLQDPQGFAKNPIGSGPFQFVSWKENQRIKLKRFDNYHAGPSLLEGIEYLIYPGIQIEEILNDFLQEQLHEMPVYARIPEELVNKKNLHWIHRPSLSLHFYGFNCANSKLQNPLLRRALSLAVDRRAIVTEACNGQFEAAASLIPPGMPGYRPDNKRVGRNMSRAKELIEQLKENHVEIPESIQIVSNSRSPYAQAELELLRRFWAQLGIELEVKYLPDWTEFEEYISSDAVETYRYVWFADMPDPDDFLRPLFSSESQFNYMQYRDSEVDEMLQTATGIVDPLQRAAFYQEIENRILSSMPMVPVVHLSIDVVYQPAVRGIEVSALGAHNTSFHKVWLKEPAKNTP